jgi:hypothetical protein
MGKKMMKLNFKKNPMKIETEKGYKKSYIKKKHLS